MNRILAIFAELKHHAPFTVLGAVVGILCMLLFRIFGTEINLRLFQVFHPLHVLLSALVTASLFKMRSKKNGFGLILIVGYLGSIGVATLSDSVIPYMGESILGVSIPAHADLHKHNEHSILDEHGSTEEIHDHTDHDSRFGIHLGFIEDWYIVNPAAFLGIMLACFI